MHKTTVMIEEDQHEALRAKAYKEGTSLGTLIREAIDLLLKEKK